MGVIIDSSEIIALDYSVITSNGIILRKLRGCGLRCGDDHFPGQTLSNPIAALFSSLLYCRK